MTNLAVSSYGHAAVKDADVLATRFAEAKSIVKIALKPKTKKR